ncbi:hypothetical protein [Streptomyces sp. HPF1205]|uniref:hypothetical protein n=1 Tax=Streptomyces sp. HPF1205 TaxID=2873262 RepID=UPI001CED09EC|nr:hypothetical protein [Streptomyces sp. HPF1205]
MEHSGAQGDVFRQVITSAHDEAPLADADAAAEAPASQEPADEVPVALADADAAADEPADADADPAGPADEGSAEGAGRSAAAVPTVEVGAEEASGPGAAGDAEPADAVPVVPAEPADAVPGDGPAEEGPSEAVGEGTEAGTPFEAVGEGTDAGVPARDAATGADAVEEPAGSDGGAGSAGGPDGGVEGAAGGEGDTLVLPDAIAGAFGGAPADASDGTGTTTGPTDSGTPAVAPPEPPPAPPVRPGAPSEPPRPVPVSVPVSAPQGRPRVRSVPQPPLQRPLPPAAPPYTPPQPGPPQPGPPWPAQSRPAHPPAVQPPAAQPLPGHARPPAGAAASRPTVTPPVVTPPVAPPPAKAQHGPRRPLPAPPSSVPAVDSAVAAIGRGSRRGDSVARRAGQAVRRLVVSSAAREVAELTGVAEAIQQPVATGRQIAVTSIRGGAGKTSVAALLGLTYTHYRPDPVLSVEADAALGTLPVRLGADTVRWTCADLAHVVNPAMQFIDITGYLLQTKAGGWLLPGSQGQVGARLDIPAYRKVTGALRRHFNVTVVDCETLPGELARTALDTAQARVLVTPATVEGVAGTRTVLDWMAGVPHMLPGTVVVLNCAAPYAAIDTAGAARYLAQTGVTVLPVPYDRHLAAGGVIRMPLLARDTRLAAGRLAAALLDRATGRTRHG